MLIVYAAGRRSLIAITDIKKCHPIKGPLTSVFVRRVCRVRRAKQRQSCKGQPAKIYVFLHMSEYPHQGASRHIGAFARHPITGRQIDSYSFIDYSAIVPTSGIGKKQVLSGTTQTLRQWIVFDRFDSVIVYRVNLFAYMKNELAKKERER